MATLCILDFDGTMTDAEQEGAPFRQGYLEDVAVLTGLSTDEVMRRAERLEAEVAADPDRHGWIFNGQIVAPATVDPYLRMMPVARRIFDELGCFMAEAERTRLLDGILYKYNYQKTAVAFRPGARDALLALRAAEVYIVTNSHTDAVVNKLRVLDAEGLAWLTERVYGRARKYVLDDSFTAVPAELRLPGLDRPVLLRRRAYHEVLDALRQKAGVEWSDVLVVGDIFELDLALPLALGARVALVVNAFTPAYERAYVDAHPRGCLVQQLSALPGLISQVT